ncbi:RNA polymerase sigma factor [Paractinoplanes atraurantiacus]|uniref:RNA polymerase sigma-70 factor, ECF subfamily n=1 Tax=Paractinoplanes atraurantiacus TaxID=1036182 RepID=A0A285JVM6_9ACTN|nr:RNA polymerase sigma factor [Actinoplanes atraurantiacus]SNY64382.1 RNA polymerase sigma-70 factor, ECF subfamily [Actinoplanes atraurantiacus]
MDSGSAEVEELARAAAAGDAAALDRLLFLVRPDVLRVCARFLPHRDDAEDACQDTMLALSRSIGRFEGRSSFRTWLYRLTANQARSTYQSLRGRFLAESGGAPLPERPDPRRTSVVAGTRIDLLEALRTLRPELAEAVVLRDVCEVSYQHIAVLTDVPEGTVKSRIHQARTALRHQLAAEHEPR